MTQTLLEFPVDFPVKVVGRTEPGFAQDILAVVLRYAPDFESSQMQMRPSREGKYLSLTCTIRASSQAQLDQLYQALTRHPRVVMVL